MNPSSHLLLVDDSDDHRFITVTELKRLAASKPFEIQEASKAEDAVGIIDRLVREGANLMVLADYRMPRMGGLDLLRVVRGKHPPKKVRFVVYSSTDQGVAEEAVHAGADEFMVKPMELAEFRRSLKRLVDDWQAGSGAASVRAVRRPT